MYSAFRHILRHMGRIVRSVVTTGSTGATTFSYQPHPTLGTTEVYCFVSSGKGRLRMDESGQYGGRSYTIMFGAEVTDLRQGDVLVVTYPEDLGSYKLVHVNRPPSYGTSHVQCDAEQFLPEGRD